jgi:acyl dehydratase
LRVFKSPAELLTSIGEDLGVTDWLEIDQARVDTFAKATGDHQWIHVDVEKAKQGPFGGPIAHGYLTASLANYFLPQLLDVQRTSMGVNYGCDKIRFPSPVRVGSRIRGTGSLTTAEETRDGGIQAKVTVKIEIEGQERPACVIETISRFYPE